MPEWIYSRSSVSKWQSWTVRMTFPDVFTHVMPKYKKRLPPESTNRDCAMRPNTNDSRLSTMRLVYPRQTVSRGHTANVRDAIRRPFRSRLAHPKMGPLLVFLARRRANVFWRSVTIDTWEEDVEMSDEGEMIEMNVEWFKSKHRFHSHESTSITSFATVVILLRFIQSSALLRT